MSIFHNRKNHVLFSIHANRAKDAINAEFYMSDSELVRRVVILGNSIFLELDNKHEIDYYLDGISESYLIGTVQNIIDVCFMETGCHWNINFGSKHLIQIIKAD